MIKVLVIRMGKPEREIGQAAKSWDLGAQLSATGEKMAKHSCAQIRNVLPHCQIFGSSPLIKAQQTLFSIMDELGIEKMNRPNHIHFDTAFWSLSPDAWRLNGRPSKYSNRKVFGYRPKLVIREGQVTLGAIIRLQEIAKSKEQDSAIAISHGGPLDAAIMVAKNTLNQKVGIGNVRYCEGAIFHFGAFNRIIRVEDFLRE